MGSACVIKFAFKSSIFVSTETKYVSQIHLDVFVDPVTVELYKLLHFPFFSMANDRIVCIVSRFQVKLSCAKVQSSGTNFVVSH